MRSLRRPSVPVLLGLAVALAVLAGLLWRPVLGSDDRPSGSVTLSTGVTTGVYARYGQLLRVQLARDAPGLDMTLTPSAGSVENIRRLISGEADFAIATADSIAAYQAGGGEGAERLRACARLYDDYMQLVVPADSPVRTTEDLAGLRVGVGQDQSGVQLVTRELLAAAGLDMDADIEAVREGINDMPRMLEAGRVDAFFWSGGLPTSAVTRLAGRLDIRLVPLGDLLPALGGRGPHTDFYRAAVMPPDAYPDIAGSEVVDTIAVANLLVTTEDTDAELTEQITRSVINGRDRIGQEVHAAQRVDLRTAIYTQPLELHRGARDYYRSVKS
ncbi:TAXI family TRAP transporter solute-binding subunit [Streptomyces litchfieldiae]|uniref:TAXI family TRAP transporter solute-binding subunit n=1 Tax=Streptomyces litchfieldiae TaxID=3075543 RepID=A0ABU2N085_9ACTN|nr:TAXI family TRAP transporter solute-binding subunit [Streptomyces sp. DSM 44938]MDT0347312.1 TAXI family TRAP transporter solute-binding subunit [Streptomyces sp. DSM 44938]